MSSRSVFALATFALMVGASHPASAFRTAADAAAFPDDVVVRWRASRISVGFDEAPDASDASDLASAAEAWNMVACSELEFVLGERPVVEIFYVDDWAARGLDADAIATTDLSYRGGDDEWWIAGAQILLDRARLTDSAEVDLRAVLTHELGHVLGLLHVCDPSEGSPCNEGQRSSALFPTHSLTQRMLAPDDVAGACFLYPIACREDCGGCEGEGCAWLGDPCGVDIAECSYGECAVDGYCSLGCEAPGDCPRGEACEAGLCVATTSRRYGEACDFGADCASLLCVSRGADGMCTRGCDGMACPADDECVLVEGRAVCMTPNSGGCAAGGGGGGGLWMAFLLACGFTRGRWRMR